MYREEYECFQGAGGTWDDWVKFKRSDCRLEDMIEYLNYRSVTNITVEMNMPELPKPETK